MIRAVVTRCAGGCKGRMTQDAALAHAAVICVTEDETGTATAALTLAVCDECAKTGGRERAEIVALQAKARFES